MKTRIQLPKLSAKSRAMTKTKDSLARILSYFTVKGILIMLMINLFILSPFLIQPDYHRGHAKSDCSLSYCYSDPLRNKYNNDDENTSTSQLQKSCLTPEIWGQLSCIAANECGNSYGQSPIDFSSQLEYYTNNVGGKEYGQQCNDVSSSLLYNYIKSSNYYEENSYYSDANIDNQEENMKGELDDDMDNNDMYFRLENVLKKGTCTFADLKSHVTVHKSVKTSYLSSSSCSKPTIVLPSSILPHQSYSTPQLHHWELNQFHLHVGSEHTFDGNRYDGELHLVHSRIITSPSSSSTSLWSIKNSNIQSSTTVPDTLVIGIPFQVIYDEDRGDNYHEEDNDDWLINQTLEPLVNIYKSISNNMVQACASTKEEQQEDSNGTSDKTETKNEDADTLNHSSYYDKYYVNNVDESNWNMYNLISSLTTRSNHNNDNHDGQEKESKVGLFSYVGSLTTPPCSTPVQWLVLDTPLKVEYNTIWKPILEVIDGTAFPYSWPSCDSLQESSSSSSSSSSASSFVGTYRPTQSLGNRQVMHICT